MHLLQIGITDHARNFDRSADNLILSGRLQCNLGRRIIDGNGATDSRNLSRFICHLQTEGVNAVGQRAGGKLSQRILVDRGDTNPFDGLPITGRRVSPLGLLQQVRVEVVIASRANDLQIATDDSLRFRQGDLGLRRRADGSVLMDQLTLEEAERLLVEKAVDRYQGNVSKAADALGLSRSALYRRLQRFEEEDG